MNSYRYDAWGNVLEKTEGVENPFQYVGMLGYYRDEESGLHFLWRRYLDTSLSRFLTVDELNERGQRHWYVYVCTCPMSRVDPDGRCCGDSLNSWELDEIKEAYENKISIPEDYPWWDLPEPPTREELMRMPEVYIMLPWCLFYWRCLRRALAKCQTYIGSVPNWVLHCLCACIITKDCGEEAATCASFAQEIWGGVYDPADLEADEWGINCARLGWFDCLECCKRAQVVKL